MVNNFSVDLVGLYINWDKTSLFIIHGKLPTLKSTYKKPPFIRVAFFSDVILVPNYHGCKEEIINLIPHYLIDIIYKTVKPSHLEKLKIIRNVDKPMFQAIVIFFWLNFDRANHSFLHPFCLGANRFLKNTTWSFEWGTQSWVKMHRFNAFSRNVNTINWKNFPTHVEIYKSEKIQEAFWKDKTLAKGV